MKTNTPWTSPKLLPKPPSGSAYGYMLEGKPLGCTREELIAYCQGVEHSNVQLVWTPEHAHLVPMVEVPFLYNAVREGSRLVYRRRLRLGLSHVGLWSLLCMGFYYLTQTSPSVPLLGLLFFGLIPAVQALNGLKGLSALTPDAMQERGQAIRFLLWLTSRRIPFTWTMLAALGLVGLVQWSFDYRAVETVTPGMHAAAVFSRQLYADELWRLLTCSFVHANFIHFGLCMLVLLHLGRLIETVGHRSHLFVVFMFSGIVTVLVNIKLLPEYNFCGAVGPAAGCMGYLLALMSLRGPLLPASFWHALLIGLVLLLAVGIGDVNVLKNYAIPGGILCGLLLGFVLIEGPSDALPLRASKRLQFAGAVFMSLFMFSAGYALYALCTYI